MAELLLILDLFCPVFFLIFGLFLPHRKIRRKWVGESAAVLCLALMFAPICYCLFPLEVQGFVCALLLFFQFFLLAARLYAVERTESEKC